MSDYIALENLIGALALDAANVQLILDENYKEDRQRFLKAKAETRTLGFGLSTTLWHPILTSKHYFGRGRTRTPVEGQPNAVMV